MHGQTIMTTNDILKPPPRQNTQQIRAQLLNKYGSQNNINNSLDTNINNNTNNSMRAQNNIGETSNSILRNKLVTSSMTQRDQLNNAVVRQNPY